MTEPKFEKVDSNTIRIIVEKASNVPMFQILENEKNLLEQKKQVEENMKKVEDALKNIVLIKEEAKKMGIVAKAPEKKEVKK